MSCKANNWNNAYAEIISLCMQIETVLYELVIDRKCIRQNIFGYIEVDYNNKRRHSSLGYLSPDKYEEFNIA